MEVVGLQEILVHQAQDSVHPCRWAGMAYLAEGKEACRLAEERACLVLESQQIREEGRAAYRLVVGRAYPEA